MPCGQFFSPTVECFVQELRLSCDHFVRRMVGSRGQASWIIHVRGVQVCKICLDERRATLAEYLKVITSCQHLDESDYQKVECYY
jgi:hypothetical protein